MEADNTHIKLLAKGAKLSVYAYVDGGGKSEAWKFLDGLKRENKKEAAKLAALFQYSCDRGRILVPEQFKHEKDAIYVFKAKQARLYCFFDGNSIIITNGAIKQQRKARPEDLHRAERLRTEYFERKEEDEDLGG